MMLQPRQKSNSWWWTGAAGVFLGGFFILLLVLPTRVVVVPEVLPLPVAQEESVSSVSASWCSFTGDIMLGRHVEYLLEQHGGEYPLVRWQDGFATSSCVVVNFESAMALDHVRTPSGAMRFSVASSSLAVLERLGVTHASLANNHTLDYGPDGYEQARVQLAAQGVTPFGHSVRFATTSIVYLEQNGLTIALIGLHTLFYEPTAADWAVVMAEARKHADRQVLYVHWGVEYDLVHSSTQEQVVAAFVKEGGDLVIGHHPHVTQDITLFSGVPVLYSLGNFIFDQYFSPDVEEGYVADVLFTASSTVVQLRPVGSIRSQPYLMTGEQKDHFLTRLAARSDTRLTAMIESGLVSVPFTLLPGRE